MPLKLSLGSGDSLELLAEGDLAKYLQPSIDTIANFGPHLAGLLDTPVSGLPSGTIGTDFEFSYAPSWMITQSVGITLSVQPGAACKLSILKPGDTLFQYAGPDDQDIVIQVLPERHYVSIELQCSLALDVGAQWSSGNIGVSGDISKHNQFRVAHYCSVEGSSTLRNAIRQAFTNFVLPFQAASIEALPDGDYADFEFIGKLALGFGVTYGFSGLFFAGRTNGEVSGSFATPIGKSVLSAAPSFTAGPEFKFKYAHKDAFRIVAGRVKNDTSNSVTLYLLRKDGSVFSTSESFGITLSAGAEFETDAATVKAEAQQAGQRLLGGNAGKLLGDKLASAAGAAVGAINDSVNRLFAKGDGHKIALELMQSRSRENAALFVFRIDLTNDSSACDRAMRCDFAQAITLPGVELDPQSFIEQVYTDHAGLDLQFFDLLRYHDITEYIQKTDVTYLGSRTFQIRDTVGVKSVSGLFGKEREADLYFVAQCHRVAESSDVLAFSVRLNAILTDRNNTAAFHETGRMLLALGVSDAAERIDAYLAHKPEGPVQLTVDLDSAVLTALKSTDYLPNGEPSSEPHPDDQRNYEEFAQAVAAVIGAADSVATTFEQSFADYENWLAFNRTVTDQPGSTRPGDRLSEGNPNGNIWPDRYPPHDRSARLLVQTYILAGQHFMNFCDSLKHLASAVPGVATEQQYENLLRSLSGMVRKEIPFPTYFLKPGIVALTKLVDVKLTIDSLPDPNATGDFAISLKPTSAVAAAGR